MTPKKGICESCGFAGLTLLKPRLTPPLLESGQPALTLTEPIKVSTWRVCMTCFETPYDETSPNLGHRRLPAHEYTAQ